MYERLALSQALQHRDEVLRALQEAEDTAEIARLLDILEVRRARVNELWEA